MHELSVSGGRYYPDYELCMRIMPFDSEKPDRGFSDRYRLILINDGHGVVELNDRLFPVSSPIIFPLSEKDHFSIQSSARIDGMCLYFHPSVINPQIGFDNEFNDYGTNGAGSLDYWCLRPFFLKSPAYSGMIQVDASIARRISDLLQIMSNLMASGPDDGWPCRCRSFLIETLFLISRLYDRPKSGDIAQVSVREDSLRPVILYISKYYSRKIKLEELSKEFHTNKTSLNERFKKVTGVTVMSWLITLRLQIACSILGNTTMPVSEVARRVGFADDAHFLRAFKKHIGMTPTDYRNLNCWMLHLESV